MTVPFRSCAIRQGKASPALVGTVGEPLNLVEVKPAMLKEAVYPEVDSSDALCARERLPDWNRLPGTACVQEWATDLRHALAEKRDIAAWELLGRGAIIEHPDTKRAKLMFQQAAAHAGMMFADVAADAVFDLELSPADRTWPQTPAMVFLEPGDWIKSKDTLECAGEVLKSIKQFRKRLLHRMYEFDLDAPVVFVTTINDIDVVDECFRVVGTFDRRFSVPELPKSFLGEEFVEHLGPEICGESMTQSPAKLGKLISYYGDGGMRELAILAMRRLAQRKQRKVEFTDLVDCLIRDAVEADDSPMDIPKVRAQVAYHEAGHALIAVRDSDGRNVPEYSTILEGRDFKGAVVDSYTYRCSLDAQRTYRDTLHKIRILLAGRAAEHLFAGAQNISTLSTSDLTTATRVASKAFGRYGFAPDMIDAKTASSNLALVLGTPSPSEYEHLETLSRRFLAKEYETVLDLLTADRALLDAIANRLMRNSVMDQTELAELCSAHGICISKKSGDTKRNGESRILGQGESADMREPGQGSLPHCYVMRLEPSHT